MNISQGEKEKRYILQPISNVLRKYTELYKNFSLNYSTLKLYIYAFVLNVIDLFLNQNCTDPVSTVLGCENTMFTNRWLEMHGEYLIQYVVSAKQLDH